MGKLIALFACSLAFACSTTASTDALSPSGTDSGLVADATPVADSGQQAPDAAADAGQLADAGQVAEAGLAMDAAPMDAAPAADATPIVDASFPDASPPPPDASVVDAGPRPDAGAGSCTRDEDCAPAGFCRPLQAGGSACAAYSTAGERCGGFRPPWTNERCEPGFICLDDDPRLADAPGTCMIEATVSRLLGMQRLFDGVRVGIVTAEVTHETPAACTRMACSPQMPCCNTCTADEVLADSPPNRTDRLPFSGPGRMRYTCSGTNCDWETMCTLAAGRYRVIGVFRASPQPHLEIETIRPYP